MKLRDVTLDDLTLWERLRCDPAMTAELGGPQPRDGIPDKLREDVAAAEADRSWVCVIESDDGEPMGSVVIWTHDDDDDPPFSEIGWMVLLEFQGRGIGKEAASAILERAREDGRWGVIHAFPGVSNAASNGICRSLGFRMVGTSDFEYYGRTLRCNHWRLEP